MRLKVILPHQLFLEQDDVKRVVVETTAGAMGILPHRLDCAAPLVPGILIYETAQGENYLALGAGMLVKTGLDVSIAVGNAISGADLENLRQVVVMQLTKVDEQERNVRTALAKLESNFVRRFLELKHYE
ncbi:MAG: F0F1 ATP synthase subunit epsilon [Negativicutes bacterium]